MMRLLILQLSVRMNLPLLQHRPAPSLMLLTWPQLSAVHLLLMLPLRRVPPLCLSLLPSTLFPHHLHPTRWRQSRRGEWEESRLSTASGGSAGRYSGLLLPDDHRDVAT